LAQPLLLPAPPAIHGGGGAQVPLAVGTQPRAHVVQRSLVPQCTEDVMHHAPARLGVVHVVRYYPWQCVRAREGLQVPYEYLLLRQAMVPHLHCNPPLERVRQFAECLVCAAVIAGSEALWYPAA